MIANETKVTEKITEFFNEIFHKDDMKKIFKIEPAKMKQSFTANEIKLAVKKLKNNKSAGSDEITAEQLKHAPEIIYETIADIFNTLAETGKYPEELKIGILIPLHKPGKPKGKVDSLRPVILLNTVRKILSIVMLNRIFNRIDNEIPKSQTAYRPGRSTTENIFTFKILIEKALISKDYETNIILLDMSKAFDSVDRNLLMEDFKKL